MPRAWVSVRPDRIALPPAATRLSEGRGEVVQRALEQIGQHEIGLVAPQPGMPEAARPERADQRPDAIHPRILRRDLDRERVAVARGDFSPERLGGGDGEDSGAGADIDDLARTPPLESVVEREQAAAR